MLVFMKLLDNLSKHILTIKDQDDMLEFLKGILTPQELHTISVRLEIVKRLKKGFTQHKIAKELKIGVATVTRGSKEIKKGRFKKV